MHVGDRQYQRNGVSQAHFCYKNFMIIENGKTFTALHEFYSPSNRRRKRKRTTGFWDGENDGLESGHRCKENNCFAPEHQRRITHKVNMEQNGHGGYFDGELKKGFKCKFEVRCLDFDRELEKTYVPPKPLIRCSIPCNAHKKYRCDDCEPCCMPCSD